MGSEREREADKQSWFRKGPMSWGVREREKQTHATALVQKGSHVVGSERERSRQTALVQKGSQVVGSERERSRQTALVQKGSQVVGSARERSRHTQCVQSDSDSRTLPCTSTKSGSFWRGRDRSVV